MNVIDKSFENCESKTVKRTPDFKSSYRPKFHKKETELSCYRKTPKDRSLKI